MLHPLLMQGEPIQPNEQNQIQPDPIYKRVMDYGVGSAALLLSSPLFVPFLIASALIHQSNPIFTQERVGKGGETFTIYKIKTMRNAFDSATGRKLPEEERTTRLGKFMRKSKIDELPQLLNVLRGEMSLVGPRPLIPDNVTAQDAFRQSVKPGITGLQQVTGGNNMDYEERLKLDHKYINRRNIFSDIGILFLTVGAIIRNRHTPHYGSDTQLDLFDDNTLDK